MANENLIKAKKTKNDEFYTQYDDIQKELNHYEKHFENKTVLCNCDDPFESNFCKFFLKNFNYLKLKRLICTSYAKSLVRGTQVDIKDADNESIAKGLGYVMDITQVPMKNGRGVSDDDIDELLHSEKRGVKKLQGDGDFRSAECIEWLKQADIVVTNPPFSLFREYIASLVEHTKNFLIIGNQNNITYKEIFPLIQQNKMWLGYNHVKEFKKPDGTIQKFGNVIWYTNLDIKKRHEGVILYKHYNNKEYTQYYNFNGIDVSKVSDIPLNYDGNMGVPTSFLYNYNPEQFEIIGIGTDVPKTKKHVSYKNKNIITYEVDGNVVWSTKYSVYERKAGNSLRLDDNGKPGKLPFSRIIIRRRQK